MPESAQHLAAVQAAAAQTVDARMLGLMSNSAAALIGFPGLTDPSPSNEEERDILAFVDQFVIDVSNMTDEQRDGLSRHVPATELKPFVSAFYVTEFSQRLSLMAQQLDLSLPPGRDPESAGTDVVQALRDYQAAVMREFTLDPMTTEMVRLRCARVHNCQICKTLRLDRAHSVGVDESMTAKVDFYEQSDLSPRLKRALRIADAFITRPDTLDAETAQDAIDNMTADQRASLLLTITKWSTQKVHVALGTDGAERLPTNEDGVSYFDFEEDGSVAGYSPVPS